jgi:hypothetical protein
MLKWNKTYFGLTLFLFFIEFLIAIYVHDAIVRPYIGDVLVVILIYCFIKSLFNTKVIPTAIFVLLFAFGVETLQYLNIIEILGLENNSFARIVIGTSFAWMDIICYCIGIVIVLAVEKTTRNS